MSYALIKVTEGPNAQDAGKIMKLIIGVVKPIMIANDINLGKKKAKRTPMIITEKRPFEAAQIIPLWFLNIITSTDVNKKPPGEFYEIDWRNSTDEADRRSLGVYDTLERSLGILLEDFHSADYKQGLRRWRHFADLTSVLLHE